MIAIVLLRGVNVGGVRFAMRDLAAALTAEGFERVKTVLASGNVTLSTDLQDPQDAATEVSRVIAREFGFDVAAIGVAPHTVQSAVNGYPFERTEDRHAYAVFATTGAALDDLLASAGDLDPSVERVQRGDGVVYWDVPKGQTLTSAFGRRFGRLQASGVVTTRNLNTLTKILAVAY